MQLRDGLVGQIIEQSRNVRKTPATVDCAATDFSKTMEEVWGSPWLDEGSYTPIPMDSSLSPEDAHMRLTGIVLRNLPGALGFERIDGLVISAALWDLDRVRHVGNGPKRMPQDGV